MDTYLIIIILFVLVYLFNQNKSSFSPIDTINTSSNYEIKPSSDSIYNSRLEYPYNPPVNSNVKDSVVFNRIVPSSELYSNLAMVNGGKQLGPEPVQDNTNELYYSGGTSQILEIPLQYNYPNNEILRSQKILITDYNRNKYCVRSL